MKYIYSSFYTFIIFNLYFDTLDEMIADKKIDEVKKGNVEVFSLEQVANQLGLS